MYDERKTFCALYISIAVIFLVFYILNITVRQSRQSGVARATCPD